MSRIGNRSGAGRPNVLVIVTDDQRAGCIHALGNSDIKTPNLDALVGRGTSFTRAHIPGGSVSAVCMPSRAMINSGRFLYSLEGEGQNIPPEHTTLGECFRAAGYRTCGIGKWHNGPASYTRSFTDGADIFFGGMWDHWNVPVCDFRPDGGYENYIRITDNFTAANSAPPVRADRIHAGVHSTDLFSADATDFIKNYDGDSPFFIYLAYMAPHDPRTMPEEFRTMYDPEKIPLPDNFLEMPAVNCGWCGSGRDDNLAEYPRRPESIKRHIADYYGMISHLDFRIGQIFDALKERGFWDNTIVVFMGDNGLAVGNHGLMGKQSIYEHSVAVPLVIAGPGVPEGRRNDSLCYLLDVYPTLCDLCGLDIPESVEGISLVPTMLNPEVGHRETLYFAFQGRIRGVTDGRWKLIEYRTEDLKLTQLFDLKTDPSEKINWFDFPGREQITAELRELLLEYRRSTGDENSKYGKIFWEQYDRYAAAEVKNPYKPSGRDIMRRMAINVK